MHPLWMHALDVAAVGEQFAGIYPEIFARMAQWTGWSSADAHRLLVFLMALHDLGKFTRVFQKKAPDAWPAEVLGPLTAVIERPKDPGHPLTGALLLRDHLVPRPGRSWLAEWDGEKISLLTGPVLGHHGRPVAAEGHDGLTCDLCGAGEIEAATDFVAEMERLLAPPAALPFPGSRVLKRLGWTIAGLTVLADWIGSNQRWFRYAANGASPGEYWRTALRRAETAVAAAGLRPSIVADFAGFHALTGIKAAPGPVQAWAETVPLPEGPLLILIEDMTGGGKTEAALVLAHRLMAAGRARGLYMALPTMATADAMYGRLQGMWPNLYRPGENPSLVLAHGRAHLSRRLSARIMPPEEGRQPAGRRCEEDDDCAAESVAWLAAETRRAFLADIGVGTIDQALMAVLPARHQSLRLLGLGEKVLIIDEAHAYDAYMEKELDRLVAFQAGQGSHTIILSATLPAGVKQRIAAEWGKAAGGGKVVTAEGAYPLATLLSLSAPPEERPLAPRPDLPRTIRINRQAGRKEAAIRVREAASAGAAVAWIRNTVDDVLEAAAELRAEGLEVQVFHARFAMADRLAIERDVVRRFGKEGDARGRHGRVLVASQVIEQSLDLDFDLVVTDLAPVDLLLQRAGRLWRHMERRPAAGRPVAGPELAVVSPEPAADATAKWYSAMFPRAAYVYRDPLVLWRTAREIFGRGRIRAPEDVRRLIESVYGPDIEDSAPEALAEIHRQMSGQQSAERGFAANNLLSFRNGYCRDAQPWQDETRVPTRLGEEMNILRLARWDGTTLRPWFEDTDLRLAWALSEVTVRARLVSGIAPCGGALALHKKRIEDDPEQWNRYDEDKILLPLEPSGDGLWAGRILNRDGQEREAAYSAAEGLKIGKVLI